MIGLIVIYSWLTWILSWKISSIDLNFSWRYSIDLNFLERILYMINLNVSSFIKRNYDGWNVVSAASHVNPHFNRSRLLIEHWDTSNNYLFNRPRSKEYLHLFMVRTRREKNVINPIILQSLSDFRLDRTPMWFASITFRQRPLNQDPFPFNFDFAEFSHKQGPPWPIYKYINALAAWKSHHGPSDLTVHDFKVSSPLYQFSARFLYAFY